MFSKLRPPGFALQTARATGGRHRSSAAGPLERLDRRAGTRDQIRRAPTSRGHFRPVRCGLSRPPKQLPRAGLNCRPQEWDPQRFEVLPLDYPSARQAGVLRGTLDGQGLDIGPYDLLIAGIAMANNLTVVTRNVREFSRVPHLKVENWYD